MENCRWKAYKPYSCQIQKLKVINKNLRNKDFVWGSALCFFPMCMRGALVFQDYWLWVCKCSTPRLPLCVCCGLSWALSILNLCQCFCSASTALQQTCSDGWSGWKIPTGFKKTPNNHQSPAFCWVPSSHLILHMESNCFSRRRRCRISKEWWWGGGSGHTTAFFIVAGEGKATGWLWLLPMAWECNPAPLQNVVILFFPFHAYSFVLQQVIMNRHDLHKCPSLMCLPALPGILLPPLLPGSLGQRGSPTLPARHGADGWDCPLLPHMGWKKWWGELTHPTFTGGKGRGVVSCSPALLLSICLWHPTLGSTPELILKGWKTEMTGRGRSFPSRRAAFARDVMLPWRLARGSCASLETWLRTSVISELCSPLNFIHLHS